MTVWYTRSRQMLRLRGFAGLLIASFLLGTASSLVGPFLALWGTKAVGLPPAVFGMFVTATTLCAILVATTFARWSDTHVSRKLMLLLGGTGGALGYAAYAFLRDPKLLVAIGCTVLALGGLCFSQLFAYARERFYEADIPGVPPGFLVSVIRVFFSVAWTAGPSLGAWIMGAFAFNGLFLSASLLYVLFLATVLLTVPYERRSDAVRREVREPVWRVLTRSDILAAGIAFMCIFAAHSMNLMNLPLTLIDVLGGTAHDVGITFSVGPVVEIPLMLWFGHMAARGRTLGLLRFVGIATVVYFLLLSRVEAPWHIFVLQILHGLSFAIIANVGILFFQDLVPGQAGLGTTVYANSASAGNVLGYFIFGSLVQTLGNRGVFIASAALTVVMIVILFLYRPRRVAG